MGLSPSTGKFVQPGDVFKSKEEYIKALDLEKELDKATTLAIAQETAKEFKKNAINPKFAALDALSFLYSPVGGLISNITKRQARRMMIRSFKDTDVGKFGLKKKGLSAFKDQIDNARYVVRQALKDLNRTPQKALDPTETVRFMSAPTWTRENLFPTWGSTFAETSGRNIKLNPKRAAWEAVEKEGRAPLMHESGVHVVAGYGSLGGEKRRLAEHTADYVHQQIQQAGRYHSGKGGLYRKDPIEIHATRADERWAQEWKGGTITKANKEEAEKLYRKIYDEELGKIYRGLKRDLSPKHWAEVQSKAKRLTEIDRRELKIESTK